MKFTIAILFSLLLTGCGVVLRYNYIGAVNNMPPGSTLVDVNNDYIEYTNTNGYFRAHYVSGSGKFYKVEEIKKDPQ